MLNPCKEREPRVIDNDLITKCIDRQYPKGEVGRLLRLEGIPMEEIEEIRFEHLYILKIDHLWVLRSLVKLSLNNNFIEKIENLDTLIHLRELDLSFNKIQKIENLEKLVNLKKITFYENLIETIENLDNQRKITVISMGKNMVSDKTNIHYFRKFPTLTSLNMAGNPCSEQSDFRLYIAAFLPTLLYYEYKRISEKERDLGEEEFKVELRALVKVESVQKKKQDAIEQEQQDVEKHSKMFVEHMFNGKLFDTMFENDEEGNRLLLIGEEVTELYEEYKNQFLEYCLAVFHVGEKHYAIRQTEVNNFEKGVTRAKNDNQQESIRYMEEFIATKDAIFGKLKEYKVQLDHDAIAEEDYEAHIMENRKLMDEIIHTTWKNLMRLEVTLFEQLEEVNQTFGQVILEMINNFIEECQGVFTNIRAAEINYTDGISDAAVRFMTNANVNPDLEIPEELKDIIFDRDSLNNAVATTHDIHMQIIDTREDTLIQRVKGWAEDLSDSLTKNEIARNRYKLLEINHFLDIQREEFEELTAERMEVVDMDAVDI